ncbi:glutathione-dependent formaldehyde dehydrogenase [Tersicoccus solisilvae]|uniref:Glutathione-dependent formaldehyde dehydrogenase n=1 Tax=Tersicoccus solisilvae TaxID=1882339 RepID=A0ABQ1NIY4_9MICC|nr:alcohol dehydrogenase catalytic domain-containing protein [Tersicoccus solisilvae]GGC78316.1 glutathione-dependent formaldehyde dehydrogenase [Tersicoccus solisilvae]
MKAVTWQGKRKVSTETVPDPTIQQPTDAIIEVTSTAICGSDLHLYEVLGPYMNPGDILGHEPMGIVREVGSGITNLAPGDRVVIPFNISCGHCWMCTNGLQSQCETTQVREKGTGASLLGFSELYGAVPGGQAEYLRVPHADYGAMKVPADGPDEQYLFLSDILPTAWQGVEYANVPEGGTLVVYGLGPVGQFAARIGVHRGYQVLAVEPEADRRAMAERHGVKTIPWGDDVVDQIREETYGRGADGVVDAVGMEAHSAPLGRTMQNVAGLLPDKLAQKATETIGVDALTALNSAFDAVRRGGTVSISGVYGGAKDPINMMKLFDKQVNLRMGQANVRRWTDTLMPLVSDPSDPLAVQDMTTHTGSLDDAADLYRTFQKKDDHCIKVVLKPRGV